MIYLADRDICVMSDLLKLSVSKTKTFLDCAKKYDFAYNLKLPKKEFEFHTFGKFVHKVLEDFHNEYLNGSTEPRNKVMGRVFKNAMAEYKHKMTSEAQKEAYEIIESYLKKISTEKNQANILSVEKNFNIGLSEHVSINGMIDRIQVDPDGIVHVCDYKTVKNKKYLKNDFLQLLTYAYVIFTEDPTIEKVRGSYILLRHNFEYITKVFSKEEILQIKNRYEDYAKQIEEEKLWRPNPTPLCTYCDFIDSCKAGKDFVNKNKNIKHGEVGW